MMRIGITFANSVRDTQFALTQGMVDHASPSPRTPEMISRAHDYTCLMARVKERDDAAMSELIEIHGAEMERMAEVLIGHALRPRLDAADAVQSVQIAMWDGIRTGRFAVPNRQRFIALAKMLLRRHIAHVWRKAKYEQTAPLESDLEDARADRPGSNLNPHANEDFDELVRPYLSFVDETDLEVLRLRFIGYSTAEAARCMQVNPGYLRMRLIRLRQKFARHLTFRQ
jgi:RNA polymerase sigma factor (sigma-70 family)